MTITHPTHSDNPNTIELDIAEFYVEAHHERGNWELFEAFDGEQWQEIDVWDYRRADGEWWLVAGLLESEAAEEFTSEGEVFQKAIRVTRSPELEKDVDNTYHASVSSDKIDIAKVRVWLESNIATLTDRDEDDDTPANYYD
jgi:hypothetical protein